MKKNIKEQIEGLGLSPKREIIKLAVINIIFIGGALACYIFLKQIYALIGIIFVGLIADFFFISRYSNIERKMLEEHNNEFISLLSYFEIFISNKKNVYNSFKLIIPYSSLWMQEKLETLLSSIDDDKTVKPFITFSSNFTNKVIQSVMLSIYQMVESGENNESMNQFNALFASMSNNLQQEQIKRKESKLESLNILPLFGAGVICVILIFSILVIVGGMINGL